MNKEDIKIDDYNKITPQKSNRRSDYKSILPDYKKEGKKLEEKYEVNGFNCCIDEMIKNAKEMGIKIN